MQVDPRFTSQTCSACGLVAKKTLSERIHDCSCGLKLDRDHNAALNILGLGLQAALAKAQRSRVLLGRGVVTLFILTPFRELPSTVSVNVFYYAHSIKERVLALQRFAKKHFIPSRFGEDQFRFLYPGPV